MKNVVINTPAYLDHLESVLVVLLPFVRMQSIARVPIKLATSLFPL